jgi:hypothetical protein
VVGFWLQKPHPSLLGQYLPAWQCEARHRRILCELATRTARGRLPLVPSVIERIQPSFYSARGGQAQQLVQPDNGAGQGNQQGGGDHGRPRVWEARGSSRGESSNLPIRNAAPSSIGEFRIIYVRAGRDREGRTSRLCVGTAVARALKAGYMA